MSKRDRQPLPKIEPIMTAGFTSAVLNRLNQLSHLQLKKG